MPISKNSSKNFDFSKILKNTKPQILVVSMRNNICFYHTELLKMFKSGLFNLIQSEHFLFRFIKDPFLDSDP